MPAGVIPPHDYDALFAAGRRVVAVAAKPAAELTTITADDESDLMLAGKTKTSPIPNRPYCNACAMLIWRLALLLAS